MSKPALIQEILAQLEAQLAVMKTAAAEAKANATGEETKSDGKYDTRAIEAGYLAGAQAEQAEKLAEAVRLFGRFGPPIYGDEDEIAAGALVESEHNGEIVFYLLAPAGGGHTAEYEGFDCTVLTPESRLYQQLAGRRAGDLLEEPPLFIISVT